MRSGLVTSQNCFCVPEHPCTYKLRPLISDSPSRQALSKILFYEVKVTFNLGASDTAVHLRRLSAEQRSSY